MADILPTTKEIFAENILFLAVKTIWENYIFSLLVRIPLIYFNGWNVVNYARII